MLGRMFVGVLNDIVFHRALETIPRHTRQKLALWCLFVGTNLCILAFFFDFGAEGGGSMWDGFGPVIIGFMGILLLFVGCVLWPNDFLSLPFDEPDTEESPRYGHPPAVAELHPDVTHD